MSREIKFRVWNHKDQEFLCDWHSGEFGSVQFNSDGSFVAFQVELRDYEIGGEHEQIEEWVRFDSRECELSLMQYTGLKDKNGVEIYEGDIVFISGVGNEEVKYCEEKAMYIFGDNDYYDILEDISSMMVIGNIYENPELLNEVCE